MGLYSDITGNLQAAFNGKLADAVDTVSLVSVSTTYDPATGDQVEVETVTVGRGVPDTVSLAHADGEIVKVNDKQFIILQAELAATPEVGNQIEYGGKRFHINSIIDDPAGIHWSVFARAV